MKSRNHAVLVLVFFVVTSTAMAKKYGDPPAGQGVSTVGAGGDYPSLAAAAADFATSSPTGSWTVEILNDLTETTRSLWGAQTGSHTITIKPAAGVRPMVTFALTTETLTIPGCIVIGVSEDSDDTLVKTDHFVIDGSNNGTDSRDLTFRVVANDEANFTPVIHLWGDSDHVKITNCNIVNESASISYPTSGIQIMSRWIGGVCHSPDHWLVKNNQIQVLKSTVAHGIRVSYGGKRGPAGEHAAMKNNSIIGNIIQCNQRGIFINDGYNYTITDNHIESGRGANLTGFLQTSIFYFSTNGPPNAYHKIHNNYIYQESANWHPGGYGGAALLLTSVGTGPDIVVTIHNNMIVVRSTCTRSEYRPMNHCGICCTSGISLSVVNNSIHVINNPQLTGLTTDGRCYGIGGWAVPGPPVTIVNNIISVQQGSDYAERGPSCIARSFSHPGDVINNNALFARHGNIGFSGSDGITTATRLSTFADWQQAGYDADGREMDGALQWVSESDLHFAGPPGMEWKFGADISAIPALALDMDGDPRDVLRPYVGADEPLPPTTTLTVVSDYGAPRPAVGMHGTTTGTLVSASVLSPVAGPAGTRYVCTGYSGTGSVPVSGTETSVDFTITEPSSITWNWKIQHELSTAANPPDGGHVSGAGWYDSSTTATVEAVANPPCVFFHWSGDLDGADNPASLILDTPKSVTAHFHAPLMMIPVTLHDFGLTLITSHGGTPEEFHFSIQNPGFLPLELSVSKEGGSNDFAMVLPAPATLDAGTTQILTIRYTPDSIGAVSADFKITVTNHPLLAPQTLTVKAAGINLTSVLGTSQSLGAWNPSVAPILNDAGMFGDAVSGDGIFSLQINIGSTPSTWRILKNRTMGLGGENDRGRQVDGGNMPSGGVGGVITYFYDTRDLTAEGWMPPTEGLGSTALSNIPWVAAGSFQGTLGGFDWDPDFAKTRMRDDGLGGDAVAGDGIFTLQFQAAKKLIQAEWLVVSNLAPGWEGEYQFGSNGMAQHPSAPARIPFTADLYEIVTLEYNAWRGHCRVTVSAPGVRGLIMR